VSDAARSRTTVSHPNRWDRYSAREHRLSVELSRIVEEGRAEIRKVFNDAKTENKLPANE
jgi:hypothetical protein